MRSWPVDSINNFLSSSLYLDSVNGDHKTNWRDGGDWGRIFIACLLPWQVFSVGCVLFSFLRQYLFLDFGNCPSPPCETEEISALFILPTPSFGFPLHPVHIFVNDPLQTNKFQFIKQMCHLFLDGTLIATLIYLTAVMPPVTIYFDVHFYLSKLFSIFFCWIIKFLCIFKNTLRSFIKIFSNKLIHYSDALNIVFKTCCCCCCC